MSYYKACRKEILIRSRPMSNERSKRRRLISKEFR